MYFDSISIVMKMALVCFGFIFCCCFSLFCSVLLFVVFVCF